MLSFCTARNSAHNVDTQNLRARTAEHMRRAKPDLDVSCALRLFEVSSVAQQGTTMAAPVVASHGRENANFMTPGSLSCSYIH